MAGAGPAVAKSAIMPRGRRQFSFSDVVLDES